MLVVASGPPSPALADWAIRAPGEQLWLTCDMTPPDTRDCVLDAPVSALLALSERVAHPGLHDELEITALDGFGTPPSRKVTHHDHTEQTLTLSRRIVRRIWPYDVIVLSTLSGFLDDAATRMLVSSPGTERALDAARQIASSAASHLCWNLSRGDAHLIALCWDIEKTMKGKVVGETPNAPRRLLTMADVVLHLNDGIATVVTARERLALKPGSTLDGWDWLRS